MLNKNRDHPVVHAALVDLFLNGFRDFIRSLAICLYLNSLVMNGHGIN